MSLLTTRERALVVNYSHSFLKLLEASALSVPERSSVCLPKSASATSVLFVLIVLFFYHLANLVNSIRTESNEIQSTKQNLTE